ncbi:MAG: transporter substrate-binding domain-containing protein [Dysgonomonas sp.]|nr:transporter substrate-binding domain-containing protein [Dysgonomonas sp.]
MKKTIIIFHLVALLVIALVFVIRTKQEKKEVKDYPEMVRDGAIRVVTNIDPNTYFVASDSMSGYTKDLLDALRKYSYVNFEISVENSLEKSFEGLKDGKYDLVARNIPMNADLKDLFGFTKPLIFNKWVLVQRKAGNNDGKEPLRNHLQLAKKSIYVPKNSPGIFRLRNLSDEIGDTIYVVEDSLYEVAQLAMMVATGEIEYSIADSQTAKKVQDKSPELDIKTDIGFTHMEGWAVRKESKVFLDSLNMWIDRLKQSKEYDKILKKYYK